MQKDFWRSKCHKIGYVSRQGKKFVQDTKDRESSPEYDPKGSVLSRKRTAASNFKTSTAAPSFKTPTTASEKFNTRSNVNGGGKGYVKDSKDIKCKSSDKGDKLGNSSSKSDKRAKLQGARAVEVNNDDDYDCDSSPERNVTELPEKITELPEKSSELPDPQFCSCTLSQLEQENKKLRERLDKKEEVFLLLQKDLRGEKELRKTLEAEVQRLKDKLEDVEKEQASLIDVFAEDRDRRDKEEEDLRNKLEEASNTIQKLLDGKARGR